MGRKKKEVTSEVQTEQKSLTPVKYKTKKAEKTYEFFIGFNAETSTIEELIIHQSKKPIPLSRAAQLLGARRILNMLNMALIDAKLKIRKDEFHLSIKNEPLFNF